jgi:hypothetical protein
MYAFRESVNSHLEHRCGRPEDARPLRPSRLTDTIRLMLKVALDGSAMTLLPQHAERLAASAVAPEIIEARGYRSVERKSELPPGLGSCPVPALAFPWHGVAGGIVGYQARPDTPRVKDGKPIKYESQHRGRNRLDVSPLAQARVGNPAIPLIITEGVLKGDAAVSAGLCCVAVNGVYGWLGTNPEGGKTALPDFRDVALNRDVLLAFDSDVMTRAEVYSALRDLSDYLASHGATVRYVYLPSLDGGAKCGLDDYFAAGHDRDELLALTRDELRSPDSASPVAPRWEGPIPETAKLLTDVRDYVRRYVILSDDESIAVAVWVAHTYAFPAAGSTPYLWVNSAEPVSGKTQLLEVLESIVSKPWLTGRVTAAVLPRKIDAERPTLLLDESDTAFNGNPEYAEALRGILNTGYRASGRTSLCVGQGASLGYQDFATFCPKAIAGLGKLPDTVRSRSVPIRLKRRKDDEPVGEWLPSSPPADAAKLRAALGAWARSTVEALGTARPERPEGLGDRAFDVWRPLLAIAEHGGEDWRKCARAVAQSLSGHGSAVPTSDAIRALAKLRDVFADSDRVSTATLLALLNADDALPFGDYRKGEGVNGRGLGSLFAAFEVRSAQIWLDGRNVHGYRADDFEDAFARYLPAGNARTARPEAGSQNSGSPDPLGDGRSSGSNSAGNPPREPGLADLADGKGGPGAEEFSPLTFDTSREELEARYGRNGRPSEDWKRYGRAEP